MLAKKYRFHSRGGVRFVLNRGKAIRMDKFTMVFTPNQRRAQRFAVVVSKKIFKSAVSRNRIRRRVYEAIRTQLTPAPIDHVFIINSREVRDMPSSELHRNIRSLLSKATKSVKIEETH
jgi:ribonuclease P protein component